MNPLKKMAEALGITTIDLDKKPETGFDPRKDHRSPPDATVPFSKRIAARRRKNKAARKSRQRNRS